ncbi:class I SAM-dependent methyltransferase [Lysobacter niastensis]|uniref:Methyltransferase domain-containing protein n=1 Tax=Lysobacter niastensis TaxID=380629 RepID=A0ABS0BCM0_9GAMM|nr:methyltransferase domain-containing protein [Lysobacter niastensis]MBF6026013.1 methyltransferase domain-containing protein [Lysobacter niastensis]
MDSTCKLTVNVGTHVFRLRALSDLNRCADTAQPSQFGHLWPSARVLAETMNGFAVAGLRVLEIGCGLGLPSLVLKKRGADITASDHHPLAEAFLAYNTALNGMDRIAYRDITWAVPDPDAGQFDLIIGSDVLREGDDGARLSRLVLRHAAPNAEIVITDPGRGVSAPFTRAMQAQGFAGNVLRPSIDDQDFRFRIRLLKFRRSPERVARAVP